jgi:hypothetical protein
MRLRAILLPLFCLAAAAVLLSREPKADPRLAGSERGMKNGWITVRLAGAPEQIGYQHGYLLAREIADSLEVARLNLTHGSSRDWAWYRKEAQSTFWPKVEEEYRREISGIAEGVRAAGLSVDLWDLVALNANIEFPYYTAWLDGSKASGAQDRCSAFVATGSATRDGRVVIGHNNWSGYLEGARWNVIFDVRPRNGHRFLMDGSAGLIHSGDDFGLNSAGIVITETTITAFHGFDPAGVPEFVRARKAMQYSSSIDDFVSCMRTGNNGGYANAWLVADIRRNEIARLELGLKNVTLERKSDGWFTGANFPINPKLTAEETTFPPADPGVSAAARRVRWDQLMEQHKGRIDLALGKQMLADHYDAFEKKPDSPNERTLCGHIDLSPRGIPGWVGPYSPAGAVQNKITDAARAGRMEMEAAAGHSCGIGFRAAEHLESHPEYAWQAPLLRDLPAGTWAAFAAPK